ncbi:hypothetical protein GCM10010844_23030 [Deinococcus radiotolerans]|uniref:Uncharacterized protein n=2 Tax=Deinococcus radiotolerans TaxID=1309407 RepID=A0ABQ2FK04_9DEIO|nr:hypothetical protein GCM10010844_23030 [Deinococcus radiotolerans]
MWEQLTTLFDPLVPAPLHPVALPTPERIAGINRHFGTWFAGLGPDEASPTHVLSVNRRATTPEAGQTDAPDTLVIFNQGYDGDDDRLDATAWVNGRGAYRIVSW